MAQNFRIDWTDQHVAATSTSDAHITVPAYQVATFPTSNFGSWWLMGVSGQPTYINMNAAATSANILHPIGRDDTPKWLPGGVTIHGLTATGTGQIFIVRCYVA
jgi:hypothetical protein